MKSTPPMAFLTISLVLGTVWPMYWPTRSSRDGDEMAFADVAEPVQEVGHPERDRRLAGAGIAGEAHVQRRRLVREPHALARPLDEEERGRFADALLHGPKPDQALVQLAQHRADAHLLELPAQVDGRDRILRHVGRKSRLAHLTSPFSNARRRAGRRRARRLSFGLSRSAAPRACRPRRIWSCSGSGGPPSPAAPGG